MPRSRLRPSRLTLLLLATLAVPAPIAAATIPVDTLTDTDLDDGLCSLREAILAANSDATHFGCPAGSGSDLVTLELTGTIALGADLPVITKSLTLAGPAAGTLTVNGNNHELLTLNGAPNGRTLRIERLTLRNGLHATAGGGITVRAGDHLELVDSRIVDCESLAAGGAIHGDQAASITLLRSTVENNIGQAGGGGVALFGEGTAGSGTPTSFLRIEESTIRGNSALGEAAGGGVAGFWTNGEIRSSTLSGNTAESSGGGLVWIYGALLLDSVTVTLNTADVDLDTGGENGGGVCVVADALAPATVDLHNSVIGNNLGGALPSDVSVATNSAFLSQGFNLVGVRNGADALFPIGAPNANDDWVGTRSAPVLAGLAGLADNGGPTKTHAPSPGSLLVDHGECPDDSHDQRGFGELATGLRPVDNILIPDPADGCDIGAYEADGVLLPVLLLADGFETGTTAAWSSTTP